MTAFMIAYIFGFAIVLVVFWGFTLLAGWPRIASAFVALCIVAATIAFAISVSTNGPDNLVPTAFFWISATSGLLVFGKLGRIFAQDWLLGHDREKPLAALPS